MATKRFGYLDDFSLKNQKVGIGTSTANEKLEVLGGTKGGDVVVLGIATLTSYSGFQNTKTSYVDNVNITGGESGTLSGEVVIGAGLTMSVGTGATTGQGNIKSLKVSNTFTPPIGGTNDRPSAPQPGTLYYNKDFRTIEYWDGSFWRQVDNVTRMGRGVCSGGWNGNAPGVESSIEVFSLASQGEAIDFGSLAQDQREGGGASNSIRGIVAGGGPGNDTHMEYYTMASGGTGIDFGNLTSGRRRLGGLSSSSRAVFVGGRSPGNTNIMDYVEIMTLGDASDFGDMSDGSKTKGPSSTSSPTRGIIANGYGAGTGIDAITISSKGNGIVVGQDLFHGGYNTNGASTGTRGVWAGGYTATAASPYSMTTTSIRGIDIASGGNATEFGNLIYKNYSTYGTGTGSNTRGFWMGGADEANSQAAGQHILTMNLKSGGEAENWGDLTQGRSGCTAFSDCHGGLGGF